MLDILSRWCSPALMTSRSWRWRWQRPGSASHLGESVTPPAVTGGRPDDETPPKWDFVVLKMHTNSRLCRRVGPSVSQHRRLKSTAAIRPRATWWMLVPIPRPDKFSQNNELSVDASGCAADVVQLCVTRTRRGKRNQHSAEEEASVEIQPSELDWALDRAEHEQDRREPRHFNALLHFPSRGVGWCLCSFLLTGLGFPMTPESDLRAWRACLSHSRCQIVALQLDHTSSSSYEACHKPHTHAHTCTQASFQ